jgi:hypothetical protein
LGSDEDKEVQEKGQKQNEVRTIKGGYLGVIVGTAAKASEGMIGYGSI